MSLTRNYEQDSWSLSEDGRKILTVKETVVDGKVLVTLTGALRSDTIWSTCSGTSFSR